MWFVGRCGVYGARAGVEGVVKGVVKAMDDLRVISPVWEFWQLAGHKKCAMENGVILNWVALR